MCLRDKDFWFSVRLVGVNAQNLLTLKPYKLETHHFISYTDRWSSNLIYALAILMQWFSLDL